MAERGRVRETDRGGSEGERVRERRGGEREREKERERVKEKERFLFFLVFVSFFLLFVSFYLFFSNVAMTHNEFCMMKGGRLSNHFSRNPQGAP